MVPAAGRRRGTPAEATERRYQPGDLIATAGERRPPGKYSAGMVHQLLSLTGGHQLPLNRHRIRIIQPPRSCLTFPLLGDHPGQHHLDVSQLLISQRGRWKAPSPPPCNQPGCCFPDGGRMRPLRRCRPQRPARRDRATPATPPLLLPPTPARPRTTAPIAPTTWMPVLDPSRPLSGLRYRADGRGTGNESGLVLGQQASVMQSGALPHVAAAGTASAGFGPHKIARITGCSERVIRQLLVEAGLRRPPCPSRR